MDILIYKSKTKVLMEQQALHHLFKQLPPTIQSRAHRYKSELSQYNYIVGRLLLKKGLDYFGLDTDLDRIEYLENGKPTLPEIYFSISHSDHEVICGFSREGQLGVDIEHITPIDFDHFAAFFSAQEWIAIKNAEDPIRTFYRFWTRKESIIKANGLTLNYLHQIDLDMTVNQFVINGKPWFMRDIFIGEGYLGSICSEKEIGNVEVVGLNFELPI
jgi:4'-phosphopantetheinyl transferase